MRGIKLTVEKVDEMRRLLDAGMLASEVARRIGCSDRSVYEHRLRWKTGLKKQPAKKKPKVEKQPNFTMTLHGHHFGPLLLCIHCGFKHPDNGAWSEVCGLDENLCPGVNPEGSPVPEQPRESFAKSRRWHK